MIESLENELVATIPPSKVIASTPLGKELLDSIEGMATLLDSGFIGWEPPYTPLPDDPAYDEDELSEIDRATAVKQIEFGHNMDWLATKHGSEFYQPFVTRLSVAAGLFEAASIRCRRNNNYQGALSSWLKWLTHRDQSAGWGLNPEAYILLTEIHIGLRDVPKAKQTIVYAIAMVATELEQRASYTDGNVLISHQLPEWLEQLNQLRHKIENLSDK